MCADKNNVILPSSFDSSYPLVFSYKYKCIWIITGIITTILGPVQLKFVFGGVIEMNDVLLSIIFFVIGIRLLNLANQPAIRIFHDGLMIGVSKKKFLWHDLASVKVNQVLAGYTIKLYFEERTIQASSFMENFWLLVDDLEKRSEEGCSQ